MFRDISKASIATEQDFDGTNEMEELVLNLKDDDAGPRVQIMGANEVYANDPRQRRLDEFQITQKTLKPVICFRLYLS
jgi:dihydrofolate reductase